MKQVLLIAGPSGSGKTTIARAVAQRLGLPCLAVDDFFIRGRRVFVDAPNGGSVRTFERPELYDGAAVAERVRSFAAGAVVEGFCAMQYQELFHVATERYYIDVPFDICLARRMARRPQRPSDQSFAVIGRGESAQFVETQMHYPGVRRFDGMLPLRGSH